jgi:hypothetical protein
MKRIRLIERSAPICAPLAQRQRPLVELTGLAAPVAPPAGGRLLRPGSLRDAVHSCALLETLCPRCAAAPPRCGWRSPAHALQQQARGARLALQGEIRTLDTRRRQLAGLETAQRLPRAMPTAAPTARPSVRWLWPKRRAIWAAWWMGWKGGAAAREAGAAARPGAAPGPGGRRSGG